MGLDYSFVLIGKASATDALLHCVSEHLSTEGRQRIQQALPWRPGSVHAVENATVRCGIAEMAEADYEPANHYCLTFLFAPDEPIIQYYATTPIDTCHDQGRLPIGCVWTDLQVGEEFARLQATAATSRMSRLFVNSPSIWRTWGAIAESAMAKALFLDVEDHQWLRLWPTPRSCPVPDVDSYAAPDFSCINVDAYCREALRLSET